MKLFLDDEREPPEGWHHVRRPDEAIECLRSGDVTHLSLDHDLGDDERGTGYDVILWMEEATARHGFRPPKVIKVHSANASARLKMEAGVAAIRRLADLPRPSAPAHVAKETMSALQKRLHDWGPIGFKDCPADEYESLAPQLTRMLRSNATFEELVCFLDGELRSSFGVEVSGEEIGGFVREMVAWYRAAR